MKTNHNAARSENAMLLELVANVTTKIIIGRATTAVFTTVGLNYREIRSVFPTSVIFIAIMSECVMKMGLLAFAINPLFEFLETNVNLMTALAPTTIIPPSLPPQNTPVHLQLYYLLPNQQRTQLTSRV
jgi:hypothetical protein